MDDINNKKERDYQPLIQTRNWIYSREELEHFDSKLKEANIARIQKF